MDVQAHALVLGLHSGNGLEFRPKSVPGLAWGARLSKGGGQPCVAYHARALCDSSLFAAETSMHILVNVVNGGHVALPQFRRSHFTV